MSFYSSSDFARQYFIALLGLMISFSSYSTIAAQEPSDFTALGDPSYAQSLDLSDEQVAQVATILDERRNAIVTAAPNDRTQIFAKANSQLSALLTDSQKQAFGQLVSGGKLRFSFRNESWSNVLQWFAGQADLALVMNEVPAGNFTYSDAKNHSPTQAIDLLNSVLQSKGFTLVRREKMLIVAKTSEGLPYDMVPKVAPEELNSRGRFEYVSVLFSLKGRPVDKVTTEVSAFLGANARATPLPATGQLMVVDTAGRVDAIRKLIDSIPLPPKPKPKEKPKEKPKKPDPPPPVFQVHTVQGLDIGSAIATLEKLYGDAKFTGDAKAEQITAFTPAKRQEAIAQTLAQMTANVSGDNEPRLEIYSVVNKDIDQLQNVLAQANPGVQISGDQAGSRLLVVGDAEQQQGVIETLKKLDAVEVGGENSAVGIYDIDPELANQVVELLRPLIPRANIVQTAGRVAVRGTAQDQQIAKSAIDQLTSAEEAVEKPALRFHKLQQPLDGQYLSTIRELAPKARISEVRNGNQLAIVATAADHRRVTDALQNVEAELSGVETQVWKSYSTKSMDAREMQSLLSTMARSAQFKPDSQRKRLMIWATPEEHEKMSTTLAAFQGDDLNPTEFEDVLLGYTVNRGDPATVVEMLRTLHPDVQFTADKRSNKILVTAPLTEQKRIQAVIQQLDTPPGENGGDVVQSYPVKALPPSTVIQLLSPTFPDMRLTPNNSRQQIAAIGSALDQEKLKLAIAKLDGDDRRGTVVGYDVKSASPSRVRSILMQLVPGATVSTGADKVVVWADEKDHAMIKQAVEQFTTAEDKKETKVYRFKNADPDAAQYMLRDLMRDARFIDDRDARTLLATATAEQHKTIADVVEQMDSAGDSQRTTEIYRFDRANARSAENVFERMAPRARVSTIYGTNSVVATASEAEHKMFRDAAEKINGGEKASITKVYSLDKKQIDVEDLRESIDDSLRSRLALRMNEQTNSLIVRGSAEDQALMQQLIDEIIAQVPLKERRTAKVYQLKHADPNAAADILRDLLENARVRDDEQTGTITVTALAEQHVQIAGVLEQLDIPGQQTQQTTEIYRFDRTDARSAEMTFQRLMPRARVSRINGTNSVVATATDAEHTVFRETAEKLNGSGSKSVTKVYPLDRDQIDAEDVLASIDDSLMSRMSVRINEAMNGLIVRGTDEDQLQMQQLIDEIIAQVPALRKRVAKIYQFKNGRGRSARYALRDVFDDATIGYDDDNNTLIVTASEEDQERIGSLVQQMDQPLSAGTLTKIYSLDSFPARRMDNIVEDMVGEGEVTYDDDTNVLVVTASEDQHERVKEAIDSVNNVDNKTVDRVYALKTANPSNIQNSIERLMPQVRVASDADSSTLIVSGSDDDQARVQQLVTQLDAAPGQESIMRAYVIENADGKQTFQSLQNTFNGNGNFSLSFQEATKTIFLVATPKNHEIFGGLLNQLDSPTLAGSNRTAQTYALQNMSGNAGKAAVTALLQGTTPPANVELDDFGNTLIVVGTEEQQKKVASTLGQMSGTETDLEVFELAYVDPWTVESAVDALYANQPMSASPTITSDYFSNRLFVRGSTAQIDQIKSLLKKMGERSVLMKNEKGSGDVRTIPFRGDVTRAVEQIQQIWPRIRKNRIQVVTPSDPGFEIQGTKPKPSISPLKLNDDDEEDDGSSVRTPRTKLLHYVALQTSTRAPAADEETAKEETDKEASDADAAADTPVVIVPEGDRITIASSDHEALDQLEELLSVMSRADSSESSMGSDFAVFLLRNTGASDMRQLLGELFEQLRKNGGGGGGSSRSGSSRSGSSRSSGMNSMSSMGGFGSLFGPSFGNVAVVADDRLNALIIHGDRKERDLIEELLRVLDSEDLANPIIVYQPELVTLKNTQARRVLGILRNVYKSQLSSGGGRKKVDIPEGVSSEVASVLQQINASAGSAILSLDVDETTNSIVMRAPPELRKEVKLFVESLDTGAGGNRSRNVRVIRIQRGKSDQIREALEQFILDRRDTN